MHFFHSKELYRNRCRPCLTAAFSNHTLTGSKVHFVAKSFINSSNNCFPLCYTLFCHTPYIAKPSVSLHWVPSAPLSTFPFPYSELGDSVFLHLPYILCRMESRYVEWNHMMYVVSHRKKKMIKYYFDRNQKWTLASWCCSLSKRRLTNFWPETLNYTLLLHELSGLDSPLPFQLMPFFFLKLWFHSTQE